MVPDDHARPRGQMLCALYDFEAHARAEGHGVFEGARGGPLGEAGFSEQAEGEGGEDAVGGAEEEGPV